MNYNTALTISLIEYSVFNGLFLLIIILIPFYERDTILIAKELLGRYTILYHLKRINYYDRGKNACCSWSGRHNWSMIYILVFMARKIHDLIISFVKMIYIISLKNKPRQDQV